MAKPAGMTRIATNGQVTPEERQLYTLFAQCQVDPATGRILFTLVRSRGQWETSSSASLCRNSAKDDSPRQVTKVSFSETSHSAILRNPEPSLQAPRHCGHSLGHCQGWQTICHMVGGEPSDIQERDRWQSPLCTGESSSFRAGILRRPRARRIPALDRLQISLSIFSKEWDPQGMVHRSPMLVRCDPNIDVASGPPAFRNQGAMQSLCPQSTTGIAQGQPSRGPNWIRLRRNGGFDGFFKATASLAHSSFAAHYSLESPGRKSKVISPPLTTSAFKTMVWS